MNLSWLKVLPNNIGAKLSKSPNLQKIIGNTGWLFGERILGMTLSLLIGVLVARYLGPKQYGTYNFVLAFVLLFEPLCQLGLNSIVTRDLVRHPQEKYEILGTAFTARFIAGCFSSMTAIILIRFLRPETPAIHLFVLLLAASRIFQACKTVNLWFEAEVASKYIVITRSLVLLITSSLNLLLVWTKSSLFFFVAIASVKLLLENISLVLAYQLTGGNILQWRFNYTKAKTLLAQSWPLILSSFGAIIYLKIDQIMLGKLSTDEAVGIYAVASRMSEIWYFVPLAIASSVFPSLLKSKERDRNEYHHKLQRIYDILACLAFVIAGLVSLTAVPLINLLFGAAYQQASVILTIHIWACVFIFMRAIFSKWLIAEDMFIYSLVTHGLGAIINVMLNLWLIPKYSGVGAAIATVFSYATASYIALFVHPKTMEAGRMMTLALIAPIRVSYKIFADYRNR